MVTKTKRMSKKSNTLRRKSKRIMSKRRKSKRIMSKRRKSCRYGRKVTKRKGCKSKPGRKTRRKTRRKTKKFRMETELSTIPQYLPQFNLPQFNRPQFEQTEIPDWTYNADREQEKRLRRQQERREGIKEYKRQQKRDAANRLRIAREKKERISKSWFPGLKKWWVNLDQRIIDSDNAKRLELEPKVYKPNLKQSLIEFQLGCSKPKPGNVLLGPCIEYNKRKIKNLNAIFERRRIRNKRQREGPPLREYELI